MSKNKWALVIGGIICILLCVGMGLIFYLTGYDKTLGLICFLFCAAPLIATIIGLIKFKD